MSRKLTILLTACLLGVIAFYAQAGDTAETLLHDEMERTYRLYVPDSYDESTPVPLLIALHPSGADGAAMASITGFNELAESENFIVAYPEGPYQYWDYGADLEEWEKVEGVLNDPDFVAALLDSLSESYNIDPARIYAVGYSNGARMAFRMGCDLGGRLAAIGAVAATISDDISGACGDEGAVSVIYLHGTQDNVTPWDGKPLYMPDGMFIATALSAYDTAVFWATHDVCNPQPLLSQNDANPNDSRSVQRAEFVDCQDETAVTFYGFTGGGHSWSLDSSIDTTRLIWDFFAAHPRAEMAE
jgi:polyhydroxybutyrate depolymerase